MRLVLSAYRQRHYSALLLANRFDSPTALKAANQWSPHRADVIIPAAQINSDRQPLQVFGCCSFLPSSFLFLDYYSTIVLNMAERFGQKILNGIHKGINEFKNQSGSSHPVSHPPPAAPAGGARAINNDERMISPSGRGTYPRLTCLSDGSILAAYTQFEGSTRTLRVARSTDQARSFSELGEVTRGEGDVDNMYLLEIAPSVILAAFRNHDTGPHGPAHFRITVCRSRDGGRTWEFAAQATEKGPPNGVWEPFMRKGRRGEVQLIFSQEFAHDNQCSMLVASFDQGSTWTKPHCLHGEGDRLRDGMTGIAETQDQGRDALVMVFETTRHGTFNLEALISYDDGMTWGWRHEVYTPPRGHNSGSPQIASFADGSMAVIFMSDENQAEVQWTRNATTKVIFGGPPNNGYIQWSQPSIICDQISHWPGIMALDHHTLLAAYECQGPRARTISWRP